MLYKEALEYLNSFINYERIDSYSYDRSFKLERMFSFLEEIGRPQDKFKSIHIAGTKGKGSTAAFTYSILKEAGFKVGLYTSPHLISFRERIRISRQNFEEELIKKEEVGRILEGIKPVIERFNQKSKLGNLTFFEVYTALAFLYFAQEKVDLAVLEVGLGGRLDATNTVNPLVCAITPISFDHMEKLGHTLDSIAQEKAGIIKENGLVVSAPQEKEALEVIEQAVLQKKAKLYRAGRDILWEKISASSNGQEFNLKGIYDEYRLLKTPLLGEHQVINAAVALGLIELLRNYNFSIPKESIARGFNKVYWPGRLQVISSNPLILLDGAQNQASALALKNSLINLFPDKKIILILGISTDKDIEGLGSILCPEAYKVIFTRALSPRAAWPKLLEEKLWPYCKSYAKTQNAQDALNLAQEVSENNTLIVATGSLYLVGEMLKLTRSLSLEEQEA